MPERPWKNCRLPLELSYDVTNHVWVRPEPEGFYTLGITDVGQTLAGELLYCDPKPAGTTVGLGRAVALIESGKSIWPVRCPIPGEIAATNPATAARPNTINRDPYGEGWIVRLRAEGGAAGLGKGLAWLVTGPELPRRYLLVMEELGFGECIPLGG